MKLITLSHALAGICLWAGLAAATVGAKPLKVFIMAGQSNMDGQAEKRTIDFIGEDTDPARAALLGVFKPDGTNLVTRSDVWVANPGVYDILQPGFGGRNNYNVLGTKIGPEYAFGYYMGEAFDEQVLLIKYGPGGQSLYQNFRPPSAGVPAGMTADQVGDQYRVLIGIVHDTLNNLKTHFPAYNAAAGYEIAGFVWFQGYNDQFNAAGAQEYGANLVCLINDLRAEFAAPNMKVVVGVMGVNGVKNEIGNQKVVRDGHRFINTVAALQGNAKAIESAPLLHPAIVAIKTAGWLNMDRDLTTNPITAAEQAMLDRATSNQGYHYYGEGRFFILLGKAFAETMLYMIQGLAANAQSVTLVLNMPRAITLTGSGVDGASLSYAIARGPAHGTLAGTPPNLTYTPAANYLGADSFTFTVSSGGVTSTEAAVSIMIGAANGSWSNPAGGVWSEGCNWASAPASATTTALIFSVSGTYTCTNDRSENPFILNRINFDNPAVTLLGGSLQLAGANPVVNQNTANPVVIGNPLNLAAGTTFGGTGTGAMLVSATLTGTAGLTKIGPSTLTFTGTGSTLVGATAVSAGTLAITNGGSLTAGAATTVNSGSSLVISGGGVLSDLQTYLGSAVGSDNNSVTVTGTGSRLLRGAYPGASTHRLYLGSASNGGQGGNGNTLTISNGGYVYSGGGNSDRSNIGNRAKDNKVIVTGAGSQWYIVANNLYIGWGGTGGTFVDNNNGVLIADGGLVTMGSAQFANIGTANTVFNNYVTVTGAGSTWAMAASQINIGNGGTTAGSGGTMTGVNNTLTVTNGGVVSNLNWLMVGNSSAAANNNRALVQGGADGRGLLEINTGIVAGSAFSTGNTVTVDTGGILQLKSATPTLTIAAGNSITINGATLAYKGLTHSILLDSNNGGAGSVGAFIWSGSNSFRLNGSSDTGGGSYTFGNHLGAKNYTGLELFGTATLARAITLDGNHGATMLLDGATATVTGGITLSGAVEVTASGAVSTLTGVVSGSGALTKAGSGALTLKSLNTYTGATTVSAGTLKLVSANSNNETAAVTIAATGATLELDFTGTDTVAKLIIGTTELSAGVYKASGNAGAGTALAQLAGTGTLTVTSGARGSFGVWAAGFSSPALSNTSAGADPDHDGMENALEYVLGSDPRVPDQDVPSSSVAGSNLIFTFKRSDAAETADVALLVQVSTDLVDWTTLPGYSVGATSAASTPGVDVNEAGPDNTDLITVTIPKAATAVKVARLRVTVTP
jgi:autotransporter-associated beta strand protein/T5SS/PEP-CTERM-associated repeat protein